jgi:O-antigen ligase
MYNSAVGAFSGNNNNVPSFFKKDTSFRKQFPVFAFFFISLITIVSILYFFDFITITALFWLFIISSSAFILIMDRHWAMYLIIIAIPFFSIQASYILGRSITQQVILRPINFVVFFVLCALLVEKLSNKTLQTKGAFPTIHLPVIVLCIWGIVSEGWTPGTVFGIDMGITLITNAAMYFLISYYGNSMDAIKKLMLCWIGMAMFVAVFMLISIMPGNKYTETFDMGDRFSIVGFFTMGRMRAEGIAEEKSGAIFVSIAILFAAGLAANAQKTTHKILLCLSIAFMLFAFFFSQSKAPLAGLVAGFLFITPFLVNIRKNLIKYLCYIGVSSLIIFIIFFNIVGYLLQKTAEKGHTTSRLVSSSATSEATSLRFEYWETAIKEVIRNDAYLNGLGIGGGTYYLYPPVPHTHNIYISIICDFGLVGFIVLFAIAIFLGGDMYYTIKKLPTNPARTLLLCIYASMIAMGVSSLSDFSYAFTIAWALLGLTAAVHKYIRNYTLVQNKALT